MRALLHAHSSFSYDGEPTLSELSQWGARRGLDFIFLTEHTNDFDEAKMQRYVEACGAIPDGRCRIVPGLEFAIRGGFHLLGFNVQRWRHLVEPMDAVKFIQEQGGLAVLAHPARYRGRWPEPAVLDALDGIEAWNARYDGRFLPSGRLLEQGRTLCEQHPGTVLFGGQDLHRTSDHRLVMTEVAGEHDVAGFVAKMRDGQFRFGARGMRFESRSGEGSFPPSILAWVHGTYRAARSLRDRVLG